MYSRFVAAWRETKQTSTHDVKAVVILTLAVNSLKLGPDFLIANYKKFRSLHIYQNKLHLNGEQPEALKPS